MRDRSKEMSEARSMLTGPHRRQLHQHPDGEAVRPRARGGRLCARGARAAHRPLPPLAAAQHAVRLHACRRSTRMLVTGTGGARDAAVDAAARSRSAPSRWRCRSPGRSSASPAGSPSRSPTIFENIGVVQEGMMTIARPIALTDRAGRARRSRSRAARSRFEDVRFGYGRDESRACIARCSTPHLIASRARRSAWSAAPAPASRRWSTCCCASSTSKAAAS